MAKYGFPVGVVQPGSDLGGPVWSELAFGHMDDLGDVDPVPRILTMRRFLFVGAETEGLNVTARARGRLQRIADHAGIRGVARIGAVALDGLAVELGKLNLQLGDDRRVFA